MTIMKAASIALALFLTLCVVTMKCADAEVISTCTMGAVCFPSNQVPSNLTNKDSDYYCCLQRNTTRSSTQNEDGTYNCSCKIDLSLPGKLQTWAEKTRSAGRMCSRQCDGKWESKVTVSGRFTYCCPKGSFNVTTYDVDKEEFIGCRCAEPVPTPDPTAYVVPSVVSYNSTGESCSYNAGCQNLPSVKCESHAPANVTFCCYGSRGMVTQNDGKNLTRCTCSDEVYGAQCEVTPVEIASTKLPCLSQCSDRKEEDSCTDGLGAKRCCPNNMVLEASQTQGNFSSCICKAQEVTKGTHTCDSSASHGFSGVLLLLLLMLALLASK